MKFGNKSHLNAKPRLIKFKVYNEAIQKALPIKKILVLIADDFTNTFKIKLVKFLLNHSAWFIFKTKKS